MSASFKTMAKGGIPKGRGLPAVAGAKPPPATTRTIFAGGYRMKLSGTGYLDLGAQYAKGSRVVPEGASGEGTYNLSVLIFTGGLAFGF